MADLGRVLDATELLAQMAELIDEQIVNFVPSEARPRLTPVGGWIPEGHRREWEAAWESLGNELPDSDPKIDNIYLTKILDHIHSCGVLGISPLFPSHNVEQQTMRALEIMSDLGEQIPRLPPRYQPVYGTIARIPLPKIENLRWGDLVKIRKNDEAFAAFRTGTTRLLRQFENSSPSSIRGMAHFVADADGELKNAQQHVRTILRSSATFGDLPRAGVAVGFAIGGVVLGAALDGGLLSTLISAAFSSALPGAADVIRGRSARRLVGTFDQVYEALPPTP